MTRSDPTPDRGSESSGFSQTEFPLYRPLEWMERGEQAADSGTDPTPDTQVERLTQLTNTLLVAAGTLFVFGVVYIAVSLAMGATGYPPAAVSAVWLGLVGLCVVVVLAPVEFVLHFRQLFDSE